MRAWCGSALRACAAMGVAWLCAPGALAQPGNDLCSQAMAGYEIPPMGGMVAGTLAGATRDAAGTSCPTNQTGADVYHTITPTMTGIYTFETCSTTSWDTVLSVHTPPCPASTANQIAGGCSDDYCNLQSHVGSMLLQAGQTYIVRVGAYSSNTAAGAYTLTATFTARAPNDECGASNPALTLDAPVSGDTGAATTSLSLPSPSPCGGYAGSGGGADLFYRFVAPWTGGFVFSTCGSTLDTVVSVHSGCPATPANLMACNDDAGSNCPGNLVNSQATAQMTGGQTYFIRVAGYGGSDIAGGARTGPFTLIVHRDPTVQLMGACCGNSTSTGCAATTAAACTGAYQGDTTTCSPNPCPLPMGACCWNGGGCTSVPQSECTSGVFRGVGIVCQDESCPGVCCIGAVCVLRVPEDCSSPGGGVGAVFLGGTTCNSSPTANMPCCRSDFNKSATVTVQDIFDYLNAWFAGSPFTHLAGPGQSTVQDIFDFLSVWFAGGC